MTYRSSDLSWTYSSFSSSSLAPSAAITWVAALRMALRLSSLRGRAMGLHFDLARDFHDVARRQIEPVHHFHRVSIQKREQRQSPVRQRGVAGPAHYEVTRGEIHPMVGIDRWVEVLEVGQGAAQVRDLDEAEPDGGVPDAFSDVLRVATLLVTDPGRLIEFDRQRHHPFVKRAHVLDVMDHQRRNLLG